MTEHREVSKTMTRGKQRREDGRSQDLGRYSVWEDPSNYRKTGSTRFDVPGTGAGIDDQKAIKKPRSEWIKRGRENRRGETPAARATRGGGSVSESDVTFWAIQPPFSNLRRNEEQRRKIRDRRSEGNILPKALTQKGGPKDAQAGKNLLPRSPEKEGDS